MVHTSDSSISQNIHIVNSSQRQIAGILQKMHWIALWGYLALEEAMELSIDSVRVNN
jgi:hypothetical protein